MLRLNPLYLKHTFSVSRYIQLPQETVLPQIQTVRAQWIISAKQTLFHLFDLELVPRKSRSQALDVMIHRWSPFNITGRHIVWEKSFAMVWIWDGEKADARISDLGVQAIEIFPESILQSRQKQGAIIFRSCDGGYVCQLWHQEILAAEKYFHFSPEQSSLIKYFRGLSLPPRAGITHEIKLDTINSTPDINHESALNTDSWQGKNQLIPLIKSFAWESWFYILSSFIFITLFLWLLVSATTLNYALTKVEDRIEKISAEAEPILTARDRAISSNEKIKTFLTLVDIPDQRALMASILKITKAHKADIREWNFSINQLQLIVEGNEINALKLQQDFEALYFVAAASLEKTVSQDQHKLLLSIKSTYAE